MAKILVVDDEERIVKIVSDFLKKDGFEVDFAFDGVSAWAKFSAKESEYSLLILDIMMPGYNGWELSKKVRSISKVPIIMLTARSDEFDELTAYESGVDEYVTKPFRPTVLVKRVAALVRRYSYENHNEPNDALNETLVFNKEAHEVRLGGTELSLTIKEYSILQTLYDNAGTVFNREKLLDLIWGSDYEGDIRTVDSHMARLRIKLGTWGDKHLKTVYGLGYKLEGIK